MIKYTAAFVDKLENILSESAYMVRYERGNFQSGWCLLDHKRIVVLNRFLNTEGRVNTLVDLIPQLKIDYDKLTLNSQKIYDFLAKNHIPRDTPPPEATEEAKDISETADSSLEVVNGDHEIKTNTENTDPTDSESETADENTSSPDQVEIEEVDDQDEDEDEDGDGDDVENDDKEPTPSAPQS